MIKVTEADRAECLNMQSEYKESIERIAALIKIKENDIQKATDELESKEKKLSLALLELQLCSNIIAFINIAYYRINQKPESDLNEARIHLTKVFAILADIFGMSNDDTLNANEKILDYLANSISDEWKYEFVCSLGYIVDLLRDTYGDSAKWKNLFLEFEYRLAIASKNFINYKTYIRDLDPEVAGYRARTKLMNLTKEMLLRVAEFYRMKYEITDKSIDDMRIALALTNSLRTIYSFLGETEMALEQKKTADLWKKRLDADLDAKKKL